MQQGKDESRIFEKGVRASTDIPASPYHALVYYSGITRFDSFDYHPSTLRINGGSQPSFSINVTLDNVAPESAGPIETIEITANNVTKFRLEEVYGRENSGQRALLIVFELNSSMQWKNPRLSSSCILYIELVYDKDSATNPGEDFEYIRKVLKGCLAFDSSREMVSSDVNAMGYHKFILRNEQAHRTEITPFGLVPADDYVDDITSYEFRAAQYGYRFTEDVVKFLSHTIMHQPDSLLVLPSSHDADTGPFLLDPGLKAVILYVNSLPILILIHSTRAIDHADARHNVDMPAMSLPMDDVHLWLFFFNTGPRITGNDVLAAVINHAIPWFVDECIKSAVMMARDAGIINVYTRETVRASVIPFLQPSHTGQVIQPLLRILFLLWESIRKEEWLYLQAILEHRFNDLDPMREEVRLLTLAGADMFEIGLSNYSNELSPLHTPSATDDDDDGGDVEDDREEDEEEEQGEAEKEAEEDAEEEE